ncbi:late secretory pathway protein AVL9-like [Stylophora pistillata]|uniref:late secretory pathway protein AVL9-like n=1 Tax=Stylophora pistillata TaxID=50429 RepID=UPI000C04DA47|nr:late secretory pathway protein AVL9-like [Stylophora pistillata]
MNNEIPKIWSYIESTLAPFIMAAYGASKKRCEDARFQATSAAAGPVPKKTEDVINSITRTIKSFDKRQISQHIKLLEIKSMKSVGFSYNTLAPLIGVHPRKLCDELLEIPGAKKGRHYYLHKDSPTTHFKTKKGIDQVGKSSFNKSISVPGSSLSTNFIELVERKYAGGQASENGCDGEQRKKERKSKNKGDQNKAECEEEESLDECKGDDEDESGGEEIRAESEGVERSMDGIKGEKNLDEKGEEESETDDSEGEESMDEKVGEETVDEGEGDDNQDGSDHEESQEESNGIDSEGECKGEDIHLHSKGIQSKDQRKDNNVNKEKIPVKRKYRVKTEAEKLKDGLSITASTLPLKRCRRI